MRIGPNRRGVALLTTIITLLSVVLLVAGLFVVSDLQFKAERNRGDAARALMLAEAGATHAMSLLKGSLSTTSLASLLATGELPGIPAAGVALAGGKYFVAVKDDPADGNPADVTDDNGTVVLVCTGRTHGGSEVTINQVVARTGSFQGAMAVGGPLEISGKPQFVGSCGSVHSNGAFTGGGEPSTNKGWSTSTGTSVPSNFKGTPKVTSAPQALIPAISPASKCTGATNISSSQIEASTLVDNRTYCRTGNLEVNGDMQNAKTVSIIATGSIKVSGKPKLKAHHPEGFVLLAGGDVDLGSEPVLEGAVYCGGRIKISSKADVVGIILCRNDAHSFANWADKMLISGDARITAVCGKIPTIGGTETRVVALFDSIAR